MIKISILVPVYNVEKYLAKCLDSILGQTFQEYEIICMDDGSTDGSGAILDEYARKDDRIRVVHKENAGYGKTMNQAMLLAGGKYIGIVESDDTIDSGMFQTLYDKIEEYDLDVIKSDFYLVWDNEDGTTRKMYYKLTEDRKMYNRVLDPNLELEAYLVEKFTWNALYRRKLLIQNQVKYQETPGASYQDNGFWFQTFYWAKRVMLLDMPLYNYRQDNQTASSRDKKKVYAMKDEFDFIRRFMKEHGDTREKLYQICFHLRMLAYLSTLGRIDFSLKMEFAGMIKEERRFFEKQGEACYDWMKEEQAAVIRNPEAYVDEKVIGCRELESILLQYSHIVIYGAGIYGERAVCRIRATGRGMQDVKVAVTELKEKGKKCQGIEVCELKDCMEWRDVCLVILAVKEGSDVYLEMLAYLKNLQFRNIVSITARSI